MNQCSRDQKLTACKAQTELLIHLITSFLFLPTLTDLPPVLVSYGVLVAQQHNKTQPGFIWLLPLGHNPSLKEVRAGTQGRNHRRTACWLTLCFIHMLTFNWFSYTVRDHLSRDGTTHRGPGPPSLINNYSNALQICPQSQTDLGN